MKYFLSFLSVFLLAPVWAFSDVAPSNPAFEAIEFLSANEIVNGYNDGTFRPNENINRVAFLKLLIEGDSQNRSCTNKAFSFSDTESGAWYDQYLQRAANCGFVKGYPDGSFRPAAPINHAEAAKILYNVYQSDIDSSATASCAGQTSTWFKPFTCALEKSGVSPRTLVPEQSLTRADMARMVFNAITLSQEVVVETPAPEPDPEPVLETTTNNNPPAYKAFTQSEYESLRASNTPFVLNFSASWCPVCRALDNQIKSKLSDLPNGTIVLKADYDKETALKSEFGITRQTSGVFFSADGSTQTANGTLNYKGIQSFFE